MHVCIGKGYRLLVCLERNDPVFCIQTNTTTIVHQTFREQFTHSSQKIALVALYFTFLPLASAFEMRPQCASFHAQQ
jgi:hypothetical protein